MMIWLKSHFSASSDCVEIAELGETTYVRDSKQPVGEGIDPASVITLPRRDWGILLGRIREGEPSLKVESLVVTEHGNYVTFESTRTGTVLTYTNAEWNAFLQGVRSDRLDLDCHSVSVASEDRQHI